MMYANPAMFVSGALIQCLVARMKGLFGKLIPLFSFLWCLPHLQKVHLELFLNRVLLKPMLGARSVSHNSILSIITLSQVESAIVNSFVYPSLLKDLAFQNYLVVVFVYRLKQYVEVTKANAKKALSYKFYVLGQIGLSKQCRPRSDCFEDAV